MGSFLEVLTLITIGIALLWFGYTLFFGSGKRLFVRYPKKQKNQPKGESRPGDPQTCPVCSAKLEKGRLVKSMAYPSFTGKDRLMHIKGCAYCLAGDRARVCPVCGVLLQTNEFLIARIFERPNRKSHVHVLGCSRCRGPGKRPH